ncbi:MAG: DNA polymerase III subunit delta [Candidatus Cloacimonadales bacterium]|nr:DNA polymerase III subunit delta [Candidatus Cloacimonadales bacterium]
MSKKAQIPHYDFLRDFPNQKRQNTYYIVGTESYLIDIVQKAIIQRFMGTEVDEFDFTMLYGDTNSAVNALEQLEMSPFMSKSRMVVIRSFDQMKTTDKNLIAEYIAKPLESSILVLTAETSDARIASTKIIEENSVVIACRSPYGQEDLIRWLRAELGKKKINMDNNSIILFAGSIENDYSIASNELEKLIIFTKNRGNITYEDVEEVVGKSKSNKIFDLQNALGQRNLKMSLLTLENILSNEDPNKLIIFIITMLSRYFLVIWKILALRANSISDSEIANRHLNDVYYKFRNDYIYAAKNYNYQETKKILSTLLQADIDAKSLNIKEEIILHTLIFNICMIKK